MSLEELKKIHQQIDEKMQELEDSGLTREEVLYDQQVKFIRMNYSKISLVFLWQMIHSSNLLRTIKLLEKC